MRRSLDFGVTLFVVLLVVGEQPQDSVMAFNSPAKKTASDGSFSVWFRPEPGLPRKKDMKVDKLNRLIGADYNEMWMSKTAIVITVRSIAAMIGNIVCQYNSAARAYLPHARDVVSPQCLFLQRHVFVWPLVMCIQYSCRYLLDFVAVVVGAPESKINF